MLAVFEGDGAVRWIDEDVYFQHLILTIASRSMSTVKSFRGLFSFDLNTRHILNCDPILSTDWRQAMW